MAIQPQPEPQEPLLEKKKTISPQLQNYIDRIRSESSEEKFASRESEFWDDSHDWNCESVTDKSSDYQHYLGQYFFNRYALSCNTEAISNAILFLDAY